MMNAHNTQVAMEIATVLDVDPKRMVAKVAGLGNLGVAELPWCDYSCPGEFAEEDSSWGGRVLEKGTKVLVLVERTSDVYKQVVRAYIIGCVPLANIDFVNKGYDSFRNGQNEPFLEGDSVQSTSARNFYKVSSSGNILEECTPGNYRKLSPEENTNVNVHDNSYRHVSGFIERATFNEFGDKTTHLSRTVWRKLPKVEHNDITQRDEALKDANNVVVLEEIGGHVPYDHCVTDNCDINTGDLVYKLSVINNGTAVYSKLIDSSGNVYEGTKGKYTFSVLGLFWQIANQIKWTFASAIGAITGAGSGIIDWVATRVNFRRYGG